jgi:hypothetical protein
VKILDFAMRSYPKTGNWAKAEFMGLQGCIAAYHKLTK